MCKDWWPQELKINWQFITKSQGSNYIRRLKEPRRIQNKVMCILSHSDQWISPGSHRGSESQGTEEQRISTGPPHLPTVLKLPMSPFLRRRLCHWPLTQRLHHLGTGFEDMVLIPVVSPTVFNSWADGHNQLIKMHFSSILVYSVKILYDSDIIHVQ